MAEEMELDPQLKALLEKANLLKNPGDGDDVSYEQLRQSYDHAFGSVKSKVSVRSISNQSIPGPDGNQIPIRIYQPADAKPRNLGLPILIFCHGGGFYAGNLDTHDDLCRNLGHLSAYIVVAVDYRLAPEHKFPAGHMDCYTATKWAYDNASAIGGDPKHVAVGGDSAGGSMAAAVCLLAQDMNGPKLTLQVLMYPMTQPTALYESKSMEELGTTAPFLSKARLMKAYEQLVKDPEEQKSKLLDLNHAPSVKNLPPAYIATAEYDPLRDEAEAYAARLFKNNVPTKAKRYGGATHGFIHLGSLAEIRCSVRALEDVAIAMRQVVKEEKEPWDLRSYLMVVAVVVAFLSVKVWHYYKTGIAV